MEILNATDAKREFGEVLLKVQNSPISINKNGKPVAVVLSVMEYEELYALKEEKLKLELQKGIEDLKVGRTKESNAVFNNLRGRIIDA